MGIGKRYVLWVVGGMAVIFTFVGIFVDVEEKEEVDSSDSRVVEDVGNDNEEVILVSEEEDADKVENDSKQGDEEEKASREKDKNEKEQAQDDTKEENVVDEEVEYEKSKDLNEILVNISLWEDLQELVENQGINSYKESEYFGKELSEDASKDLVLDMFSDYSETALRLADVLETYMDKRDGKEIEEVKKELEELKLDVERDSVFLAKSWIITSWDFAPYMDTLEEFNDYVFESTMNLLPLIYEGTEFVNEDVDIDHEFFIEEVRSDMREAVKEISVVTDYIGEGYN